MLEGAGDSELTDLGSTHGTAAHVDDEVGWWEICRLSIGPIRSQAEHISWRPKAFQSARSTLDLSDGRSLLRKVVSVTSG